MQTGYTNICALCVDGTAVRDQNSTYPHYGLHEIHLYLDPIISGVARGGASRGLAPVIETRPRLSKLGPGCRDKGGSTPSVFQYWGPTEILQRRIHPNDGVHCANIFCF